MIIERSNNEVILRLPPDIDVLSLEKITRFLKYLETTKNNRASEEDVNRLADESKKHWWSENKVNL